MKFLVIFTVISLLSFASVKTRAEPLQVMVPSMDRESPHRDYADALLKLALKKSEAKYGPFEIRQQSQSSVIKRQLLELKKGKKLSVAISMPTPEWLANTRRVEFPILRGLASYRFFLGTKQNANLYSKVHSLADLKKLDIGQGPGWSTGKILRDNGFNVTYGGPYPTLIPMLEANRFQLLMRSVYEVGPEWQAYKNAGNDLIIVSDFCVFTYLPMYFFVAKNQPLLAERLKYGLDSAFNDGSLDALYRKYFKAALELLTNQERRILYINNTNIDSTYFEQDKPYLLPQVIKGFQLQIKKDFSQPTH